MFSTKAYSYNGVYTPRQAAEFLSDELGINISYRKYYMILRELGIINEGNIFLPPYNEGTLFWHEQQDFYGTRGGYKNTHLKVFTNHEGLKKVIELFHEQANLKKH